MLRSPLFAVVIAAVAAHLGPEAAAACPSDYRIAQLEADVSAVEAALRADDGGAARSAATALESGLPCLTERLQVELAGRAYRAIAAGKFFASDEGKARQWYATAVEVDPQFTYAPDALAADHELREVYRDLQIGFVPAAETVPDRVFAPGTHLLDGRELTTPTAVGSRPHLYQLDHQGVHSWVIAGNAFPDSALVDPNAPVAATSGKKGKPSKDVVVPGAVTTDSEWTIRERPPEKTPLLVAGVVVALGASALYGYSFVTEGKFLSSEHPDDADKYAKLTNQLNLAAAGVAVASVATLSWGAAVDGRARPMPVIRARF